MSEGRCLCGVEAAGGLAGKEVGPRIEARRRSRIDMRPKPHLTKWTLVMAIKIRRFDRQAEAEAERDKAVERGERAYVVPPLAAWTGRERGS
jgi:hypothetical protein